VDFWSAFWLVVAKSLPSWMMAAFTYWEVNYHLVDLLFNRGILKCPDATLKDRCLAEIPAQILIFQVCAGTACTSLIALLLTRTLVVAQAAGGIFGTTILAAALLIYSYDPRAMRLRDLLGKEWGALFASGSAVFSMIAAVILI